MQNQNPANPKKPPEETPPNAAPPPPAAGENEPGEIDLNTVFPDETSDLNALFPDSEMKRFLKKIERNKKEIRVMTRNFAETDETC